jgi:hypothetical protein
MDVVTTQEFMVLEREVRQLRLAVAGLTETVDRHEHEGRRLGPSPAFQHPLAERLHLDEGVGSGTDNLGPTIPARLTAVEKEIAAGKARILRAADRAIADEELMKTAQLKADPGPMRAGATGSATLLDVVAEAAKADLGPVRLIGHVYDEELERRAEVLVRLRAEGPFKISPHDRAVIISDGGRMICAVYNHDERDALVALLNGR